MGWIATLNSAARRKHATDKQCRHKQGKQGSASLLESGVVLFPPASHCPCRTDLLASPQFHHLMQGGLALDVIILQGSTVFQLKNNGAARKGNMGRRKEREQQGRDMSNSSVTTSERPLQFRTAALFDALVFPRR
jgi:hypothetical protein